MKAINHPILKTIVYGLVGGLSFVPMSLMLNAFIPWSQAVCMTLWLLLTGYALILNRWGKHIQLSTAFPLLLLLPVIFLIDSMALFFMLALIVISWIRSGICYQNPAVTGVAVELLLCLSGAALVRMFTPVSLWSWALGVWLFFLIQSLYFVFFEDTDSHQEESARTDAFERARRQAEGILTDMFSH